MGQINLKITLDNSDFKKKIDESTNAIKNSGKTAEEIGKKVQEAINNYSLGAKELLDVAKQNFKEQSQIVKQVAEDIEVMQAKLKNMPPSTAQQELTKDVIAAKQALKEETAILDEKKAALDKVSQAYKEHSSQTEKTANKLTTLRTQTRIAREELSKMEQEGLRGTDAYNELQIKLGKLTDQMGDTQKQAKVLADDERYLTATIQAISGIAGMFSVAQGAVGLFGEENENLQRIMMKVQSLMAITIGLQQVAQVVNKDSAVSILFLSKAQTKLATSLGISTAAAKAFMIAITGGLVIGLMALMALFDKLSQKRKEDEEKAKEQTKAQEEFYKTIGDNAAKSLTEFTILQKQYNKVGDTFAAKNKFLQENKKKYEELGLAIKSVADQENLLIKNKDAYINSVISKAYADAYRADIAKKFAEVIKLENAPLQYKSETKVIKTNEMVLVGDAMVRKQDVVFDEAGTQKNIEAAMNAREKAVNTLKSQIVKDTENLVDLENKSAEDLRKAGINSLTEDKKQKDLKDISSYGKAIADIWQKIYQDIEQAKANAINNEFARTTELNVLNAKKELGELDKQIEAIKQKRIEQAKAEYINKTGSEKGFVAPIITLTDEEKRTYEERAKQIIDNVYKLNQQAYENLIGDYQTYEEKRNAIQKEYGDKRKIFEQEGLTKNIEVLNQEEEKALDTLNSDYAKSQSNYVAFVEGLTDKKISELQLIIQELSKLLTTGDFSEEEKVLLNQMIKAANNATKEITKKGIGKESENTIKALNEITEGVNNAINSLEGLDEKTKAIFQSLTSMAGSTIKVGEGFIAMSKTGKEALSSLEKASVILTIFSSLVSVTSKLNEIFKSIGLNSGVDEQIEEERAKAIAAIKYQIEQEEAQRRMKKLLEEELQLLQMINIERAAYKEANIFGVENPYAQAMAGAEQYRLLLQNITGQQDKLRDSLSYLLGISTASTQGTTLYNVRQLLRDINLETELFDPNTFELNPAILAAYESLPQYTQDLIDNWDSVRDELMSAQEAILSNLRDLVGEMGTELKDVLVDAFRNGDIYAAIDNYEDYLSQMIERLTIESLYASIFGDIFNQLQGKMKESLGVNGDQSIVDDMQWFLDMYPQLVGTFGDALTETQKQFSAMGLDFLTNSRTATAQGIQSISQESADRIDGMLTSVQGSIIDIKDMTGTIRERVISINENVIIIRNHTGEMAQKLDRIDYNINQMATNGINVN